MPDRIKNAVVDLGMQIGWIEGNDNHKFPGWQNVTHAMKDALELLKEQEAVEPKYNARTNWYECGNCHYSMTSGMHCRSELIPATKVRYCSNCGFPVNWEGR